MDKTSYEQVRLKYGKMRLKDAWKVLPVIPRLTIPTLLYATGAVYNKKRREGIEGVWDHVTLGELANLTEVDLLMTKNIGKAYLRYIQAVLVLYGFGGKNVGHNYSKVRR